jgi:hypothetical protein
MRRSVLFFTLLGALGCGSDPGPVSAGEPTSATSLAAPAPTLRPPPTAALERSVEASSKGSQLLPPPGSSTASENRLVAPSGLTGACPSLPLCTLPEYEMPSHAENR